MLCFHKPINININLSSPFFKHWNIRKPGRLTKYCLVYFLLLQFWEHTTWRGLLLLLLLLPWVKQWSSNRCWRSESWSLPKKEENHIRDQSLVGSKPWPNTGYKTKLKDELTSSNFSVHSDSPKIPGHHRHSQSLSPLVREISVSTIQWLTKQRIRLTVGIGFLNSQ